MLHGSLSLFLHLIQDLEVILTSLRGIFWADGFSRGWRCCLKWVFRSGYWDCNALHQQR